MEAPEGVLRVVTLNCGSLLEPDWDRRRGEIVAWLDLLDADVVCLQEVWAPPDGDPTVAWIVEHTPAGRWHWVFDGFPLPEGLPVRVPDGLRFGAAVLSRWPIDAWTLHPLPVDDTPGAPPFDRMRSPLLHVRTCGADVYTTHLVARPEHAWHRVRQVVALDAIVAATHDPSAVLPPIVCGDFNAEPDSDEIRFLTGLHVLDGRSTWFQDAWRVAGPLEPGWTQDPTISPIYAAMSLPRKRIDYVLVGNCFRRPKGAGLVLRAERCFDRALTGVVASDHVGVVADVRWPQRPGG